MSDHSKIRELLQEKIPVPLELLLNPMFSHRYFENGKLRPIKDIQENETLWKSQPPPMPSNLKKIKQLPF